jgi:multiple sugar transport system permease protein
MYAILLLFALLFLVPFFFLFMGSFKQESELFAVPFRWLPSKFSWDNYVRLFASIPFFRYLKNTMIIVVFNILGSLISCSLVAYGFARLNWRGRDNVFLIVIATMILPYQVTLVPLYIMYTHMGWTGTFLPLIIPAFFGNPFYIFLMRQFLVGIPNELTMAARVDGAGEFRIFWQVIMPLAKPALATTAIMSFMRSWNDFLGPLVFLADDKKYTLSLAASMLRSNLDPNWSLLLTLGVVMVLPVLILFFVLQKYFIQGITMSGIKG